MATPYHALSADEAVQELHSSPKGLTSAEVEHRLATFGKNELAQPQKESLVVKFFRQFNNFLIYILIIAVGISITVGEYVDATVISIILVLNAILGFIQEYKAERALDALKKLSSLRAYTLRDGARKDIDATALVPGDIIFLETGSKVPADARLLTCFSCYTLESALTGESTPVKKQLDKVTAEKSIGDRNNMVYAGTTLNM